jgi:hypothetical protein
MGAVHDTKRGHVATRAGQAAQESQGPYADKLMYDTVARHKGTIFDLDMAS